MSCGWVVSSTLDGCDNVNALNVCTGFNNTSMYVRAYIGICSVCVVLYKESVQMQ